jgi:hypothetical protein
MEISSRMAMEFYRGPPTFGHDVWALKMAKAWSTYVQVKMITLNMAGSRSSEMPQRFSRFFINVMSWPVI